MALKKRKKGKVVPPKKAPPAEPARSKKTKPTGGKGKAGSAVDPKLVEALERWKKGASLTVEAREAGLSKAKLRKAWATHLGGYDKLHDLRKQGAGSHLAFGGKRHVFKRGEKGEKMRPDDSQVKRIKSTKGWAVRTVYRPAIVKLEGIGTVAARERVCYIYTSPKTGKEYTPAETMERADLLVTWPGLNMPPGRLRLYDGSSAERKVRKLTRGHVEMEKREVAKQKEAERKEREARRAERLAKKEARAARLAKKAKVKAKVQVKVKSKVKRK
jgi:hypothetical protein